LSSTSRYADLPEDEGSIIYLGTVRRRRGERQSPDAYYLLALALGAAIAWTSWLVILFHLPPTKLVSYCAFFLPLALALAASSSLGAYFLEGGGSSEPRLSSSCRHGTLFAVALIINLVAMAAHAWNPIVGIASVVVSFFADVLLRPRSA